MSLDGYEWVCVHVELPAIYNVILNLSSATSGGIVITLLVTVHRVRGSVSGYGFVPFVCDLRNVVPRSSISELNTAKFLVNLYDFITAWNLIYWTWE